MNEEEKKLREWCDAEAEKYRQDLQAKVRYCKNPACGKLFLAGRITQFYCNNPECAYCSHVQSMRAYYQKKKQSPRS